MLDGVLDIFRVKQYFDAITAARGLVEGVRRDAGFVDAVRRALVSLPGERLGPDTTRPFPPFRPLALPGLARRRLGIAATGGSGALAALVGVFRACDEAGARPTVMSVCSGSALFAFPLGAGLSVDAVCDFTLGLRPYDWVDVGWRELAAIVPTAGRGWAGILKGRRLEALFRNLLGDMRLADLEIPTYAPIWNVEENRIEFMGPKTFPDLAVATAMHVALALPLFFEPVRIDGGSWCDGGVVDIFPVHPLLALEEPCDLVLALNAFYPPGFAGESARGWAEKAGSIFEVAAQVRTSQQIELARTNLAQLRERTEVLALEPVAYDVVRGTGFYEQFMDNRDWPQFMRLGRRATRTALRRGAPS